MLTKLDLNHFLKAFRSVLTEDDLNEALRRVTNMLGFSQFAMGHHVDLTCPPQGAIRLSTYNEDWVSHVLERAYFAEDPIHLASTKTVNGFSWHDVGDIIRLTPRHKQILSEAIGFGLGAGFTVPVHLPGEYQGTCSFAARSLDQLHENALPIAQLCGTFAFEAARRIMRKKLRLEDTVVPDLTPRQMEALVLVGRGKTDREIGNILGVSRSTAHEHVEGVRRAYGNAQRAYLIVRALFDGQIAFTDLLRR
ncbi:autoinducer binding domain-containing protein [Sphingobium fuliginis]|mgnify:CR=1 FL=1|jgi:LuxR family quorum-sensing system transcriptional regulator CciR|nr:MULTISPECIES: LuxR family transcriptional regulator [Sphingomonadaceae]MDH7970741.1 LuxR family transcriptional regulator [Sphingomonas sp. AR_OL41]QOT72249.1 autoinducer binding domain-containing protein [Sphingobium fuliginis]